MAKYKCVILALIAIILLGFHIKDVIASTLEATPEEMKLIKYVKDNGGVVGKSYNQVACIIKHYSAKTKATKLILVLMPTAFLWPSPTETATIISILCRSSIQLVVNAPRVFEAPSLPKTSLKANS